ncbi:MAG: LPS assembly protein LptD [Magnetococcus sp. DMHC-6]
MNLIYILFFSPLPFSLESRRCSEKVCFLLAFFFCIYSKGISKVYAEESNTVKEKALAMVTKGGPIDIHADEMENDKKLQLIRAHGHVHISQGDDLDLSAQEAIYYIVDKRIEATGNIRFIREGDLFTSERIFLDVSSEKGQIDQTSMNLFGPGGVGNADKVIILNNHQFSLYDATFTNCDCDQPPWMLSSKEIQVDKNKNELTSKDMTLRFMDVPIFYSPWWQQPLKPERKSGFLTPTVQVQSGNGLAVDFPYYWNIAPNRDATLSLMGISQRGVMGKLHYRYLGPSFSGHFATHDILDNERDHFRGLTVWDHEQQLGPWQLDSQFKHSITRDFINDFDQNLVDNTSRRLQSSFTLGRQIMRNNGFSAIQTGILWDQDLEATNDLGTTQQLPYLALEEEQAMDLLGPNWWMSSTIRFDNFYQMSGDSTQRVHLAPTLHYERPLYFGRMSSQVTLQETGYLVQGTPFEAGPPQDDPLHREAVLANMRLDGVLTHTYDGLLKSFGLNGVKHTIEPTVQLVTNATTDQEMLPDYDATIRDFSITNLFTDNLYSGVDRISAGEWVSYGVTSRLIGRFPQSDILQELVRLTIGQRWAAQGARKDQNGDSFSDIVAGLTLNLSRDWDAMTSTRYDHQNALIRSTSSALTYHAPQGNLFTLAHHKNAANERTNNNEENNEKLEDFSFGADMMLNQNWGWHQKADYSLEYDQIKSWRTGFRYQHDCWSLDLFGGRNLSLKSVEHEGNFIGFLIHLKGLGDYGIHS